MDDKKFSSDKSVSCVLPAVLLVALLGAPQGSLALAAPSPKGSPDVEESEGGAGEPHASSVLAGAEAKWINKTDRFIKGSTVMYR